MPQVQSVKKSQVRGASERKRDAYSEYDERLSERGNNGDEKFLADCLMDEKEKANERRSKPPEEVLVGSEECIHWLRERIDIRDMEDMVCKRHQERSRKEGENYTRKDGYHSNTSSHKPLAEDERRDAAYAKYCDTYDRFDYRLATGSDNVLGIREDQKESVPYIEGQQKRNNAHSRTGAVGDDDKEEREPR